MLCIICINIDISVFCRLNLRSYQLILAFTFAIEEINRDPHLLPNTSLGFDVININKGGDYMLNEVTGWLTGMNKSIPNYTCKPKHKAVAIITGSYWTTTAGIGTLLQLYKYPQVRNMPMRNIETSIKLLIY